jgi:hypothetical protein
MGSPEVFSYIHKAKETETLEDRVARIRDMGKQLLISCDTDQVILQSNDFPDQQDLESRLRIIDGSLIEETSPVYDSGICLQYFPSPQDIPEQNTRYLLVGFMETEDGLHLASKRVLNQVDSDLTAPPSDTPTENDLDEIELMLLDPSCSVTRENPTFRQVREQKIQNQERMREQRLRFYTGKMRRIVERATTQKA